MSDRMWTALAVALVCVLVGGLGFLFYWGSEQDARRERAVGNCASRELVAVQSPGGWICVVPAPGGDPAA